MSEKEIIEKIKNKVKELNDLFDIAAPLNIKFECEFAQNLSFGNGKVAHLILKAFNEI